MLLHSSGAWTHSQPARLLKYLKLIRHPLNLASVLRVAIFSPREARLFHKYRPELMGSPQFAIETLQLCRTARDVPGDLVECGVWRGGTSAAIAEVLPSRTSVLFDSFEGLPPAQEIDGPTALAYQREKTAPYYFDNCRASEEEARRTMNKARGAEYRIFKGWFTETVPKYAAEEPKIAVLRLDGDWYDSIRICLDHLFPHVVPNGLVIVDDYGRWDGCTRAVHDYLSRTRATEPIRKTRSGVAYLVKR